MALSITQEIATRLEVGSLPSGFSPPAKTFGIHDLRAHEKSISRLELLLHGNHYAVESLGSAKLIPASTLTFPGSCDKRLISSDG